MITNVITEHSTAGQVPLPASFPTELRATAERMCEADEVDLQGREKKRNTVELYEHVFVAILAVHGSLSYP